MRIDVVSIFPPMFAALTDFGVVGRAIANGILDLQVWNPRDYSTDKHGHIDDRPYGGGPGMVMQPAPLAAAIRAARRAAPGERKVIYLTPQGRRLNQAGVLELAGREGFILLAGRYEGVDERVLEAEVDENWSIGDYVLSGGELAAMVIIDAVTRNLPGTLGHEESARQETFVSGLLEAAHYTRPEVYEGMKVPEELMSGDHDRIRRWRLKQSLGRTWEKRPDLFEQVTLDREMQELLDEYRREQSEKISDIR